MDVKASVFYRGGDKALGSDGFPLAFFQIFWKEIKLDVMHFMTEFHESSKLLKHIGALFLTLIVKKWVPRISQIFNLLTSSDLYTECWPRCWLDDCKKFYQI